MANRKFSKFAAVLALSAALTGVGANASQAGGVPKELLGGLIGGAAGVGAGLLAGSKQGAAIGGLMGVVLGAVVANQVNSGDKHRHPPEGYFPPAPPPYEPAVVYQPGGVYQPAAHPDYGRPEYGRADRDRNDRRDRRNRVAQASPHPAPSPYPVVYEVDRRPDYRQYDWR